MPFIWLPFSHVLFIGHEQISNNMAIYLVRHLGVAGIRTRDPDHKLKTIPDALD